MSIRDVAAAAGVAAPTVSRVLNGKGDQGRISQDTQARIRAVAKQLNYQPVWTAAPVGAGDNLTTLLATAGYGLAPAQSRADLAAATDVGLVGLPEWKNAALATQYQQASWMAFCRGERALALKHLGVAVWRNLCGPRRIQKPWLRLTYRYLVGHPPGEEDFTTDLRNLGNQEGRDFTTDLH